MSSSGPSGDPLRDPALRAFCSYAQKDDRSFSETVTNLIQDLREFYEAETGRTLDIFFDRTDIGWGDNLRNTIAESIENATFLVPIVTARYFQSTWCRDELLSFYGKSRALNVTELILPIVLAGKAQIKEDSSDEVVRIVASVKYIDWSSTWKAGKGSPEWNRGVSELTERLISLQAIVEARLSSYSAGEGTQASAGVDGTSVVAGQDLVGEVDMLRAEGSICLRNLSSVIIDLGRLLSELQDDFDGVDRPTRGAAAPFSASLDGLGAKYIGQTHELERRARESLEGTVDFDAHLHMIIRAKRALLHGEGLHAIRAYINELRRHASALEPEIRQLNAGARVLGRHGDMSFQLRQALSPARVAVQSVRDASRILDGWVSWEL